MAHAPWCPSQGGPCQTFGKKRIEPVIARQEANEWLKFEIAAFLIGMGKYSYFGFSNDEGAGGGWFDVDWEWHEEYDKFYGKPLGPATVSSDFMQFSRDFENCHVTVDCTDSTYSLTFKS